MQFRRRPAPASREALGIWFGSRAGLVILILLTSFLLDVDAAQRHGGAWSWALYRFTWWDSFHYLRIADVGYLPPGLPCCDQAFLPGYPLAMRALYPLTGDFVFAGLLVSLLAGAAATALLWRVAAHDRDERVGRSAALYLAAAPYGIFLIAVYSESLFLALALGAWLSGLRRHWWSAGILAGAATGVRINGLFLTAGLAVMYLVQLRAQGRRLPRSDAAALLAPLVAIGGYAAWLHHLTGSWNAWQEAEDLGWKRQTAWPWDGLGIGWRSALHAHAPQVVVSRWADLVVAVGGLLVVALLLALRRWPEAVYLAPNVAVLICSTTLVSGPRYALAWFPVYVLAAQLTARPGWRWLRPALLVAGTAGLAALSVTFAAHGWVS